jgi:hypothetical protein
MKNRALAAIFLLFIPFYPIIRMVVELYREGWYFEDWEYETKRLFESLITGKQF